MCLGKDRQNATQMNVLTQTWWTYL